MDDRSAVIVGTIVGAVLGGVAGYLFLSQNGRELRRTLEPHLRDLSAELRASRETIARAARAAAEAVEAPEPAGHSWAARR